MKKILVCFKITSEVEHLTPNEVKGICSGEQDLTYQKKVIGTFCEGALETALRFGETLAAAGHQAALTALTAGEADRRFVKNLYAAGYGRVVRIRQAPADFNAVRTAANIAHFVRQDGGFHMILTGIQSGVSENAMVPLILCEMLGIPCLYDVAAVEVRPGGVRTSINTDGGTAVFTVSTSAVYAMGNAKYPFLRVPTLREKLAAGEKRCIELDGLADTVPPAALPDSLSHRITDKTCRFLEGDIQQQAATVYSQYLTEGRI